jgi:hypothetical protein
MRALKERHPYIVAEQLFTAGRIPVAQAVGMMLLDREFIAECEMEGCDKTVYAEHIVRDQWARKLLATSNE